MTTISSLTANDSQKVATALSQILADEYLLQTKTKNAHWNVEGIDFMDKHKLFDELAGQYAEVIDNIAERIRAIGHYAPASLKSFLKSTQLLEVAYSKYDSITLIQELLHDHDMIIVGLRSTIELLTTASDDFGTIDFITSLLQEHEKTAWILRSHLK